MNFLLRLFEDFFSLGIGVVPFLSKGAKNLSECQRAPRRDDLSTRIVGAIPKTACRERRWSRESGPAYGAPPDIGQRLGYRLYEFLPARVRRTGIRDMYLAS